MISPVSFAIIAICLQQIFKILYRKFNISFLISDNNIIQQMNHVEPYC